jgi:methylmalonyl-CoA mutase cobalamin-binding domain/chain
VLAADLMDALRAAGLDDRLVIIGGVIADDDHAKLRALGVDGVFGPGSKPETIVTFINEWFGKKP